MKIILEFDDLNPHPLVNCVEVIDKLVNRYDDIVLNFFTVPSYNNITLSYCPKWADKIRGYIEKGNVVLGVHGTYHNFLEYARVTVESADSLLKISFAEFEKAKLPYVKCFRGPYWGINAEAIEALINNGFTHLYSHKNNVNLNDQYADRIKIVYYNWNFKDTWPKLENPTTGEILVGHGHTSLNSELSCGNGIGESYNRICDMIDSQDKIEFLRIDQV